MRKKTAVLLVNLGTPITPQTRSVRAYHKHFFSDPFVFPMPWICRQFLKYLIILPFRSPRTALLYRSIWAEHASPLQVYTIRLMTCLQKKLPQDLRIEYAMRYSPPFIADTLNSMKSYDPDQLLILPLFPQYAASTTESVIHEVKKALRLWENPPTVRYVKQFFDFPSFIHAWAENAGKHDGNDFDHILFSFHGLPVKHIKKQEKCGETCLTADCCGQLAEANRYCYRAQCFATARMIAAVLEIPETKYSIAFQSRFGFASWIKPYIKDVLTQLVADGKKKVLVLAPSFVADCLETLHELNVVYKKHFMDLGGENLQILSCLNDHPLWHEAVVDLIKKELNSFADDDGPFVDTASN